MRNVAKDQARGRPINRELLKKKIGEPGLEIGPIGRESP
jgi:hypothetical protein